MANYGLSMVFQFNMIVLAGMGFDIVAKLQPEQHDVPEQIIIKSNKLNKIKSESLRALQFKSIKKTSYKVTGIIGLLTFMSIILTLTFHNNISIEDLIERFYIVLLIIGLFIVSLYIYQSFEYNKSGLVIIILIAFFNLFYFGHNFNPEIPKDWVYPQTPKVISYMQQSKDLFRFIGIGACYLTNTLMVYHVSDVRGYDLPVKKRYDNFFTTLFNQQPSMFLRSGSYMIMHSNYKPNANIFVKTKSIMNIFRLLNVKYVGNINGTLYKVDPYRQRAYLAHEIIPAASPSQALELVRTDIDNLLQDSVIIEGQNHTMLSACADTKQDAVQIVSYDPDRVIIFTASNCQSILILTDTYDNGWKAYVDEKQVPILHANYLFRGVYLEPGIHRLEFEYKPFSFKLGTILSAIALIPVIIALFL